MGIIRFDTDTAPFKPREFVPDCIPRHLLTQKPSPVLEYLKEHFLKEEIKLIRPCVCHLPENGEIYPIAWLPTKYEFYLFFDEPDYDLPFQISGYFLTPGFVSEGGGE